MKKHAYLIMAHDDLKCLEILLEMIDDKRNDIYIHIDSKWKNIREQTLLDKVKYSSLYFVDRMNVGWGKFSQIECELKLLKAAVKGKYKYYHLMSGHDLPIKSQNTIHEFFDKNSGLEFVSIYRPEINPENLPQLRRYNFDFKYYKLTQVCRFIQKVLHIDRVKKSGMIYMKGSQWFSITHSAVCYILTKEKQIKKMFKYTKCADEIFLQTILYNSEFKEKIVSDYNDIKYRILDSEKTMGNMRCIDWEDSLGTAHPRTFEMKDYDMILKHNALFARKFSSNVDYEIIKNLKEHIS